MNTTQENVNMGQECVDLSDNLAGKNREQNTVELLYTWIEMDETGFIEKQGFNFSPKYHFEMKSRGEGTYELICTEKAQCPNVWQHESIVNLTAIIGKNGAGKSSLLLCLADVVGRPKRRTNRMIVPMLQVYWDHGVLRVVHTLPGRVEAVDQQKRKREDVQVEGIWDNENPPDYQTIIHITNAYPAQQPDSPTVVHFSPGANSLRRQEFYQKVSGLKMAKNLPEAFRELQKRIISFVTEKDFSKLVTVSWHAQTRDEGFPNADGGRVMIGISNPTRWFLTQERSDDGLKRENEGTTFLALLREYLEVPNGRSCRKRNIVEVLQDALCFEVLLLTGWGLADSKVFRELTEDPSGYLKKHVKGDYAPVVSYYQQAVEDIEKLKDVLENELHKDLLGDPYYVFTSAACPVIMERGSEIYREFCKFVDNQMQAPTSFVLKHLMIAQTGQSSGEQALQNVFSWMRLPPCFDKLVSERSIQIKDNILLLLDEVDLYMHPEWQRMFLRWLSGGLNREYKGKHIQVILTTHSPLVLSDVPASNVIYLDEKDGKCTVVDGPDETFGADIFTLLRDSFFLKKSIGAFAHERICEIIDKMNQLKKSPEDEKLWAICEGYGPIIDMIGEPIIRRKLRQMYTDIFCAKREEAHDRYLKKLTQMLESSDLEERKRGQEMLHKMFAEQDSN